MNSIENYFNELKGEIYNHQKKITLNSVLGVYYGLNSNGNYRLAVMSSIPAPKLESTKLLNISQVKEADTIYWTSFDLLDNTAQKVFFTFCENLISAIVNIQDENFALKELKKRYQTWKELFLKGYSNGLTLEIIQGLFGELYFLQKKLSKFYSIDECIKAWSGPDSTSKDFSINDTWYEIKTVGANSMVVSISSMQQLLSQNTGHLVVVKVEKMSPEFSNGESSIMELINSIIKMINNEETENLFLKKISSFGVPMTDEGFNCKFEVKNINMYAVTQDFPCLKESDIKHDAITNINYSLIINSLKEFMEAF